MADDRRARSGPDAATRSIEVSVVVPVLNAQATIGDQLESLASQQIDRPWELIVVNDGSSDGSLGIVERFRDRLPLSVVDVRPSRGVTHVRNVGYRRASGEKILFCDADDIIAPGWLEAMAGALDDAAFVGGRLAFDRLNRPGNPVRVQETELAELLGIRFVVTANLGMRRDLLDRLGGFDEQLLPFSCEDLDLSLRASILGSRPTFEPAAVVHYRNRDDWREFARQQVRNGRGEIVLCMTYRRSGLLGLLLRTEATVGVWLLLHLPQAFGSRNYRMRALRWVTRKLGWLRGLADLVQFGDIHRAWRQRRGAIHGSVPPAGPSEHWTG